MNKTSSKTSLINHLLKYSVKKGNFILKSGKASTWFCDSKQTACRAEGILLVADLILESIPENTTAIGGLTAGADPIAFGTAAISASRGRNLNAFSIRKEAKDHGITGRLSGVLLPSDKTVILEDTVTRGTSAIEAVKVVREIGAEPLMILSIVDRGGVCAKLAEEMGLKYQALVTALELGFSYDDV